MSNKLLRVFIFLKKSKFAFVGSFALLLILFSDLIKADIFTSSADMRRLLNGEINAVAAVRKYVEAEQQRHQLLFEMADKYEKECKEWMQDIEGRFLGNPVAMYLIIKRAAEGWIEILKTMKNDSVNSVIARLTDYNVSGRVLAPNQTDVYGAAVALMRLQSVYQIETEIMARGYVPSVPQFAAMTAKDCFDIGVVALKENDDYYAISWFQEALSRQRPEQPLPSLDETLILENYAPALFRQHNYVRAFHLTKRLLELRPDHNETFQNLKLYESKLIEQGHLISDQSVDETEWPPLNVTRIISEYADEHYESLCRGEGNLVETKGLYCYYKANNPYLRLARLKSEIIKREPKIVIFREAVSVEEINTIVNLSTSSLSRSEIGTTANGTVADFRTSKSTGLKDNAHPTIKRLTRRVADMSDLDVEYAELSQVANYGIGGHYEEHHDTGLYYRMAMAEEDGDDAQLLEPLENKNQAEILYDNEDRIATVMFYLIQPIAGGATIFPLIDLTLFPTAGDAVFWHNFDENGIVDDYVLHAACPVLAGEKWIMNKWIPISTQKFSRVCKRTKQ